MYESITFIPVLVKMCNGMRATVNSAELHFGFMTVCVSVSVKASFRGTAFIKWAFRSKRYGRHAMVSSRKSAQPIPSIDDMASRHFSEMQ